MRQPAVRISFRQEVVELAVEKLTALKQFTSQELGSRSCKQLRASLEHVGLVEPLAVFPGKLERYLVVNGNLRLHFLRELGVRSARCTIALDDESYTYNKRVNALSPITEHFMILRAIANGVTEDRIAEGLNIDVKAIRERRNLLDGICQEVVDLLKEKRVSSRTFGYLRRMKPLRQIEAAELMVSGKNYSGSFSAAIYGVTNHEQLVKPEKEASKGVPAQAALLQETNENLVCDLAVARKTYGADVLALTVFSRCLENLFKNSEVDKYLRLNHPGILSEMQDLISQVGAERTSE
jgi:hypothetical protein